MRLPFLALGILFGFLLSRVGASEPDYYAALFLFKDLQLMQVIGGAAAVGALGVLLMKALSLKTFLGSEAINYQAKPWSRTLIPGALLFGAGWGLSGACPGTALVMLGEGRFSALFVILGMLLGTWLYGVQQSDS